MGKEKHDSMDLYRNLPRRQVSLSSMGEETATKVNQPITEDSKKLKEVKFTLGSEKGSDNGDKMPEHKEPHFGGAEIVRDVVIGLSDGLTVPFALAAGLATLESSRLVVTAGLAEVVAGAISMGLGGYMAGLSELEHYDAERKREMHEVETVPWREEEEIVEIFEPYGLNREALQPMLDGLKANKDAWVDFMMKFELSLERPSKWRTWISACTIGFSYLFGGMIPLVPYMIFKDDAMTALYVSLGLTLVTLFIFGFIKGKLLGVCPWVSGLQMMVVGGAAAGCAFGIAKAIPVESPSTDTRTSNSVAQPPRSGPMGGPMGGSGSFFPPSSQQQPPLNPMTQQRPTGNGW